MADFDRISIKISADASSATRSVNNLVKALTNLNKELGALDVANLSSFSAAVKVLANSVEALNKGTAAVRETSRAFKDLGKATSSVKRAADATKDLAHESTSLSVVKDNITEVATTSNTLLEIFRRIMSGFNDVSGGSRKMAGDFDTIETTFRDVTQESYEVVTAFDAVEAALERIYTAFSSRGARGILGGSGLKMIEEQSVFDTTYREIEEPTAQMDKMAESAERASAAMQGMTGSNLQGTANAAQQMSAQFLQTSNTVDNIKSKFKGLFLPTKQFQALEEQINKVVNKYNELLRKMQEAVNSGKMSVGDKQYEQMAAELDALRNKYDGLILKQRQLAQEGNAVRLNPNVEKSLGAFKSGFTAVTNLVKNGFVAGIRSANTHLKSFGNRVKTTLTSIGKTISSGHKATDMAKKFANELLRVSKMLKLMVTRMALRAVIKEVGNGFKSLALHSKEFNESVSSMMNGAKKLGYSFASMVSPLINALAPAINYVISLITKLLNALNQLFSILTGKTTYNRSKDFTEDWAENIEDANKNAKELKKTVLGFDELNQLQEKYSGGGDTSGNIVDMFETVDIDPKWFELLDWLKDMWKLGDFSELGTKLGEGLRDLLEKIPWDDIKDVAGKLGSSLATLINGFVEVERLGYDIGKTMAESVNTVFEFLNDFVHNLHWDSIGKFIADTFNGFFESIDWPLIYDTVVTGMAGFAEAIQNFIATFNWDNISNTVINGVNTIVDGVRAFVEGIDWLDLGQRIGDQITKAIEGIDWHAMGTAIGDVIQAAIDWVTGMLDTLPSVDELVEKATELLNGLFETVDSEQLGQNLATIFNGVYDFLVGFFKTNGPAILDEVAKFFKGFWSRIDKAALAKTIGVIIGGALAVGITSIGWEVLKIVLAEKIKAWVAGSAGSSAVQAGASSAGAAVAAKFVAGVVAFFAGAELGKYIGENIFPDDAELYAGYSGLMGTLAMVKDTIVAAYDLWVMKAEETWKNVKNCCLLLEAAFLTLVTVAKSAIGELVAKFTEFKTSIETGFNSLATNIKEKITGAETLLKGFVGKIADFFSIDNWTFSGVWEGLTKTFEKAKEGIKGVWNSIADKLNGEYEIGNGKFKIKLPKFYATGGFPEDGFFFANSSEMVGRFSNGRTAVANNAQIVDGISAGVYNAVTAAMASNGGSSGYIANTIVVDGEVIARVITKAQEKQNMRYSPSMG